MEFLEKDAKYSDIIRKLWSKVAEMHQMVYVCPSPDVQI